MAALPPRSSVWVLPNHKTSGLIAVLLAMGYAGASQSNGAAYLLCFVLVALVLVSTLHAWANLRGVAITVESIAPVFAGEELVVAVAVGSSRQRTHFAIRISAGRKGRPTHLGRVDAANLQRGELRVPARQRGCFHEVRLQVASEYPLGFCTANQDVALFHIYHVYPAPHGHVPLPHMLAPTRQPRDGLRVEGDDFGGSRAWLPGESQRHIDWKAAARGQPLLTKQWTGEVDEILRFSWDDLALLDEEARLSQLARWIVLAEGGTANYALQLPGETIPPARGHQHFHRCLRALASFGQETTEEAS